MNWYLKVMKNYAGFSGRARRKEYWMFILIYMVMAIGLSIVGSIILSENANILINIFALAHFIPAIAAGVRRMHDTDRAGWWIIVPLINLYFACLEGTRGPNQYGPDPKAGG
jgi:uncharacterized membrane protein YhaH (DUF805 family)